MITCKQIEEMMSLYIDHQLSKEEILAFEAHIQNCVSCKQELDILKQIVKQCNNLEEEPLPDEFKQQLHQKLIKVQVKQRMQTKTPPWYLNWKTYSGLAAGILIMFVMKTQFFDNGLMLANKADEAYVYEAQLQKDNDQMSMSMITPEAADTGESTMQEMAPATAKDSMQDKSSPKEEDIAPRLMTEAIEEEDIQVSALQNDFEIGIYEGQAELKINKYMITMTNQQIQTLRASLSEVSFDVQYKQSDEMLIIDISNDYAQDMLDTLEEVGLESEQLHEIEKDVTKTYQQLMKRYYELYKSEGLQDKSDLEETTMSRELQQIKHQILELQNDIEKSIFEIQIK